MRPFVHPAIEQVPLEAILHALSDPVRVQIFANITGAPCAVGCQAFVTVGERIIPKSSLSQHFKVLREAGLIRSERDGIEVRNVSRCPEIQERFPGLIAAILQAHAIEAQQPAA